jgi:hypothetical protein
VPLVRLQCAAGSRGVTAAPPPLPVAATTTTSTQMCDAGVAASALLGGAKFSADLRRITLPLALDVHPASFPCGYAFAPASALLLGSTATCSCDGRTLMVSLGATASVTPGAKLELARTQGVVVSRLFGDGVRVAGSATLDACPECMDRSAPIVGPAVRERCGFFVVVVCECVVEGELWAFVRAGR